MSTSSDKGAIRKILILTICAGSGHLQAAKAKYQEMQALYPDAQIIQRDVLTDWLGGHFGKWIANLWNKAQANGDVSMLGLFVSLQTFFDKVVWFPLFLSAFCCFLKEKVDYVIDTQIIGTSATLKAIRLIRFLKHKTIQMEKVITDLPTKEATHFFRPIKNLSVKDRALLRIVTASPLLLEEDSDDTFWQNYCNIKKEEVTYTTLPVRASFLRYLETDQDRSKPLFLTASLGNSKEREWTEKIASFGTFPLTFFTDTVSFSIEPQDKVAIVMLGSYPHEETILAYTKAFIEKITSKQYQSRRDLLFILCSAVPPKKEPIQQKILNFLKTLPNYPKTLTIIPLSHQTDSVIAPLFHRSDATFTRSGGLTSMELLCASHGKIWIHEGTASNSLFTFFLKKKTFQSGMPPWERGNARYLEAKKGAKLISPETFSTLCDSYFPAEDLPSAKALS